MQFLIFFAMAFSSQVCPSPPPDSVESPKIFTHDTYLTYYPSANATIFNLLKYKNNSPLRIQATFQVYDGSECFEHKTPILGAGEGWKGVLFYKFEDTKKHNERGVNVYVTLE